MGPALLTTGQSRWILSVLVALLSAVGMISASTRGGEVQGMFSGLAGDIRGMTFILGCTSLVVVLLARIASLILPKPWRIYTDRLEFTLISMVWICWTSATMSFSAYALGSGVCASSRGRFYLPTCPVLTFDLALLHLLSIATLTLLLVILSTALAPSYYLSLSPSVTGDLETACHGGAGAGKVDPDMMDAFVMWELAVSSPPPSPRLRPSNGPAVSNYGAVTASGSGGPAVLNVNEDTESLGPTQSQVSTQEFSPPRRRDKFAEGRVWSYVPLLISSFGVLCAAAFVISQGEFLTSSLLISIVGTISTGFCLVFLRIHGISDKLVDADKRSFLKALEVGSAGGLFILWPVAAIAFTLFPSVPNRACTNPEASAIDPDAQPFTEEGVTCILSLTIITLAWLAAWIVFARVLGLIFPLPDMATTRHQDNVSAGEEGRSLLGAQAVSESHNQGAKGKGRPQVGWGRIVAGEAFELGEDED